MREGVPADSCYVITSGTARVYRGTTEVADIGAAAVGRAFAPVQVRSFATA